MWRLSAKSTNLDRIGPTGAATIANIDTGERAGGHAEGDDLRASVSQHAT
jgi:hypothetical protein